MALNFEGFELFSASMPASVKYGYGSSTVTYPAGRFAGQCLRIGGSNAGYIAMPCPSTGDNVAVGFAYRLSNMNEDRRMLSFNNVSGDLVCGVYLRATGAILVARSTAISVNVLGTSANTGLIAPNVWAYVEIEFVRNASTSGIVNIYVNGVAVLNISGANTGSASIASVSIGAGVSASAVNVDIDDVYISDSASKLGECRIDLLVPTSDDSVQWTPNSGSTNYTQVDEGPTDGDSTFVSSLTPGNVDVYNLSNLGATPSSILAVRGVVAARKDNASTRQYRAGLVSGATTSNGATKAASLSYVLTEDLWTTDPNTGSAWTITALDALKIRLEDIA